MWCGVCFFVAGFCFDCCFCFFLFFVFSCAPKKKKNSPFFQQIYFVFLLFFLFSFYFFDSFLLFVLFDSFLSNNLIEKLPANLGNCVKLRVIRLQFNKVEILPKSIGKLRALEILWLNNNYLKDLPPTLGHCKTIQDIKAKNNHEALSKRFDWEGGTASILYELRRRLSVEKSGPPPSVELVGIGVAGEVLIPKQRFLNIIKDRCNEVMLASEALGKVDLRARQRKQEKTLKEKNRHKKKGEENLFKEPEDEFKDLTINFNWMGLTEIPPEILKLEKRLRILRMVGNKFKTIPNLAPLGGLLKLNLNANKIEELPDVFGKMRFLQGKQRRSMFWSMFWSMF